MSLTDGLRDLLANCGVNSENASLVIGHKSIQLRQCAGRIIPGAAYDVPRDDRLGLLLWYQPTEPAAIGEVVDTGGFGILPADIDDHRIAELREFAESRGYLLRMSTHATGELLPVLGTAFIERIEPMLRAIRCDHPLNSVLEYARRAIEAFRGQQSEVVILRFVDSRA